MAEEKKGEKKEEMKQEQPRPQTKPEPKKEVKKKERNPNDVEDGKGIAWLSYIGILFLIPLLAKKDNSFCMHHAKQGMVYFIIEFCLAVLLIVPFLGWIIYVLGMIFMLVMSIIGLIQALQGNWWEAPMGINGLSKKFNF
ncbi:MAG: DUF4870 domain-containing protein [Candidatus Cloacimonadota bacterium]|nr:MAG: DUF4870 domain-containing protein [Candidatus Cloacimonadota bacterium]